MRGCAFAFSLIGCRPIEVDIANGKDGNSAILDVRYVVQVGAGGIQVGHADRGLVVEDELRPLRYWLLLPEAVCLTSRRPSL